MKILYKVDQTVYPLERAVKAATEWWATAQGTQDFGDPSEWVFEPEDLAGWVRATNAFGEDRVALRERLRSTYDEEERARLRKELAELEKAQRNADKTFVEFVAGLKKACAACTGESEKRRVIDEALAL